MALVTLELSLLSWTPDPPAAPIPPADKEGPCQWRKLSSAHEALCLSLWTPSSGQGNQSGKFSPHTCTLTLRGAREQGPGLWSFLFQGWTFKPLPVVDAPAFKILGSSEKVAAILSDTHTLGSDYTLMFPSKKCGIKLINRKNCRLTFFKKIYNTRKSGLLEKASEFLSLVKYILTFTLNSNIRRSLAGRKVGQNYLDYCPDSRNLA